MEQGSLTESDKKDKNCLDREQYGKKIKRNHVENKEKRKGTAGSKERKQRHAEIIFTVNKSVNYLKRCYIKKV